MAELNWQTEYGDRNTAELGELLRSVVGSGVHGLAIEGTDNRDEMGFYVEPAHHILGVRDWREDYTARTAKEGMRSYPGDVDLIIYSLGKYLRLAIKGNPTSLLPLFAPESDLIVTTPAGMELRENRDWFLSQRAVHRFLGYMQAQHERMLGKGKRNRVPDRPELIEKYGWDVKYGSHALRLAYEGLEIAEKGTLTLPLPEDIRKRVLEVKTGKWSRDDVSEEITDIAFYIKTMLDKDQTAVPPEADIDAIESWAIKVRLNYWGL